MEKKERLTAVGFLPFLGYHHVLMILIAVAIILLCEFPIPHDPPSLHNSAV